MPPVVIGAAIVGASAVAASAITSSGAKKAAETQAQAQEQQIAAQQQAAAKEEAARGEAVAKKEAALTSPELEKYGQTLEEKIAGRGLIDVDALSAPSAVQRRAGLTQTNAAISSAASARGLGRSTIPVAQMGEASQAAERDIAERVAQLELVREQQKETALSQYGAFAESKRGGEFNVADTMAGSAQAISQNEFAIANAIKEKGAAEAANQLLNAQILAAGIIGVGQGAQTAATQIATLDLLEKILTEKDSKNAALVNIGPGKTTYGIDVQNRYAFR